MQKASAMAPSVVLEKVVREGFLSEVTPKPETEELARVAWATGRTLLGKENSIHERQKGSGQKL